MNDDPDSHILLGICRGKQLSADDCLNPRISKVGGEAAYFTPQATYNDKQNLTCEVCCQKSHMTLICQVYCPTDDYDRSLYIFACTSPNQCSLKSLGWRVFRNQMLFKQEAVSKPSATNQKSKKADSSQQENSHVTEFKNQTTAQQNAANIYTTSPTSNSVWKFLVEKSNTTSSTLSTVDEAVPDDINAFIVHKDINNTNALPPAVYDDYSDLEDMMMLLEQQQSQQPVKATATKSKAKTAKTKPTSANVTGSDVTSNNKSNNQTDGTTLLSAPSSSQKPCSSVWPAYKVTEEFEYHHQQGGSTNHFSNSTSSSSSSTTASSSSSSSNNNKNKDGDDRIQAMYRSYLQDEDDTLLVSQLPKQIMATKRSNGMSSNEDDDDEEDDTSCASDANDDEDSDIDDDCHSENNKTDNKIKPVSKSKAANAGTTKTVSTVSSSATAAVTERQERLFQKKCALYPHQVLRYSYGGYPLWCTLPVPSESQADRIPRCECCGAIRVFEMQLMPALLSLPLPSTSSSSSINSVTLAATPTIADATTSFDFGVVAIWCCPNSCNNDSNNNNNTNSSCLYSEYIVVQPPPDVVHTRSSSSNNNGKQQSSSVSI